MMSQKIYGFNLPIGTVVYIRNYDDRVTREMIGEMLSQRYIAFFVDSNDGLYASERAREYWRDHPCCHPHITLFGLLYKKLEI